MTINYLSVLRGGGGTAIKASHHGPFNKHALSGMTQWVLDHRDQAVSMYTIVPEAEVNTGEYSLVYKPRRSRGLYN